MSTYTNEHTLCASSFGEQNKNAYDDILHEVRPTSTRVRMPVRDRAAQFMPFAAVVGFNESVITAEQELKE